MPNGYTTAPWFYEKGSKTDTALIYSRTLAVAEVYDHEDAKLISAAPDLLETLQDALEYMCRFQIETQQQKKITYTPIMLQMRAAIDKALTSKAKAQWEQPNGYVDRRGKIGTSRNQNRTTGS